MKFQIKSIVLILLLASIALPTLGVFAQEGTNTTREVSLTEVQINEAFRLDNPRLQRVSDLSVDLQPGVVNITTTFALRRADPITTTTSIVPTLDEGNILWVVTGIVVDDEEFASDEVIDMLNTFIQNSWRQYFREETGRFAVTAIEITDTEINYTLEGPLRPDVPGQTNTLILTEQQINETYRLQNPPGLRLENVSIDLQPGQAVVNAQATIRETTLTASMTVAPYIEDNRVLWSVTSFVVEDTAVPQDVIDRVNQALVNSWQHYIRLQTGQGRVESVEITDETITFTLIARRGN